MGNRFFLFTFTFVLLSGCSLNLKQQQPLQRQADEQSAEMVEVITGKDFCYPVENDNFNHPIDKMPVTITEDVTIWPRIQEGLVLSDIGHPRIDKYTHWYKKNPRYMAKVQQRSARYLHAIVELLDQYKLPKDLALLPIVESAYEPFSYSHGQASGLWQFIPMTAERFKLQSDWWKDDRRNTLKSTEAAIKYLSYLHRYFDGDWLVAIAAYNAGEGNLRKAIKKNQARDKPITFWHLDIPNETRDYVPKLIALSKVIAAPEKYGIELLAIPNKPYFETVSLSHQLDLAQAANLMDAPIEELYYLNPDLNQWATPPQDQYIFKIPADKKGAFTTALKQLPKEQRINWERHKVKSGESLSVIAQKYNSNVKLIKEVNQLPNNHILKGMSLMIPTAKDNAIEYTYSQSQRLQSRQNRKPSNYKVKVEHMVKPGDSFWSIAKKHKVSISQLTRWNNKSPKDSLRIGEKLVIWQTNTSNSRSGMIRKVYYTVRNGDSLAKIAGKFKVKVSDIVRWNQVDPKKYVYKGQKLTLYVDVSKTSY